jgi:hypothetical protein
MILSVDLTFPNVIARSRQLLHSSIPTELHWLRVEGKYTGGGGGEGGDSLPVECSRKAG